MKGIVDRFEGKYAVVEMEDRRIVNLEIDLLPEGINEDDCIEQKDGAWYISLEATDTRKKKIDRLMGDLFE